MRKLGLVAAATLALLGSAAHAKTTIVYAGRVITDASKPAEGPSTVTITDDRITAITPGRAAVPAGAEVVDLGDKTLLPGLIDLHVHLTGDPGGDYRSEAVDPDEWGVVVGAKNAAITLRAGFTTVREAGSAQYTAYALRRGTTAGFIEGPRIVAAGPALSIIGGHGDVTGFREDIHDVLDQGYTCTGALECAEKVRKASRAGADVIKITATGGVLSQQARGLEGHFTSAELQSIADTAHSLGLKVMAHAHGAGGITASAAAGIDSIEHGTFADDATLTVQTDHVTFDGAAEIRRMFTDFFANSKTIRHEIRNIVVEEAAGKVATEQGYIGDLKDGSRNDMHNCNFFDFDAEGKFKRVIIWMAGTNPLH